MTITYLNNQKQVLRVSADTRRSIDRDSILENFRIDNAVYYVRIKGYLYTASDIYAGRSGIREVA